MTVLLFLPETCRNIVGDGSQPTSLINTPLLSPLEAPKNDQLEQQANAKQALKGFNPFSSILMLKDRGTLAISVSFGIYYMIHTCLQASLSTIFVERYAVSGLVAGLIYIPFGIGASIAAFLAGSCPLHHKIGSFD